MATPCSIISADKNIRIMLRRQRKPIMPVKIKASYQPQVSTIIGTSSGVMRAPTFVPALKIPVARARSFLGNHSATVLIDAGKLPASPSPRRKRTTINPTTEAERVNVHGAAPKSELIALNAETIAATIGATKGDEKAPIPIAQAWAIAATLQSTIARANPFFVPILSISFPTKSRPMA